MTSNTYSVSIVHKVYGVQSSRKNCPHFAVVMFYCRWSGICCGYVSDRLSFRLSVTQSITSRVQPTTKLRITQRHTVAQEIYANDLDKNHPAEGAKYRWSTLKSVVFNQYLAISQKQCKIRTDLLWKVNRNSYAPYSMMLFPETLCDP